jgi:hypothetical protein
VGQRCREVGLGRDSFVYLEMQFFFLRCLLPRREVVVREVRDALNSTPTFLAHLPRHSFSICCRRARFSCVRSELGGGGGTEGLD